MLVTSTGPVECVSRGLCSVRKRVCDMPPALAMSLSIDVGSDSGLSNGEATPGKMKSPRDLEGMTPNGSRISLNGGSELSDESELEVTP